MDSTDFSEISSVLQDGGVDLLMAGHWHYYQRMAPLYPSGSSWQVDTACLSPDNHTATDPKFTTMFVSGAVGDVERNDGCPGDPSLAGIVVTCTSQYGYGTLAIHNATHAFWQFQARPTPIGAARNGRTPFRLQAGYSDEAWVVRAAE